MSLGISTRGIVTDAGTSSLSIALHGVLAFSAGEAPPVEAEPARIIERVVYFTSVIERPAIFTSVIERKATFTTVIVGEEI